MRTSQQGQGSQSQIRRHDTDHCIYYQKNHTFGVLLDEVTERTVESDVTSFNCIKDDITLKGSIDNNCLTCSVKNRSVSAYSDRSYNDLFSHLDDDEEDQKSLNLLSFNLIFWIRLSLFLFCFIFRENGMNVIL